MSNLVVPSYPVQASLHQQFIGSSGRLNWMSRVRAFLDAVDVRDRQTAHTLCQRIPAQCPFDRDVLLFGRTLFHIPPICKLNPFYEEVVRLRFRALCYLADECGEDIAQYI